MQEEKKTRKCILTLMVGRRLKKIHIPLKEEFTLTGPGLLVTIRYLEDTDRRMLIQVRTQEFY